MIAKVNPIHNIMNVDEPIKRIEGRVVSADIGMWAGFPAGPVILELDDGRRIEFRYDKDTEGPTPIVGKKVAVDYMGDQLLLLKRIELVPDEPRLISEIPPESYIYTRFKVPSGAFAISLVMFLSGAALIVWGQFGEFHRAYAENTTLAFGAAGVFWIILSYGVWWYASKK
jgi:hypothetical protein